MSKRWIWLTVAALAGAALARWQLVRLFTEEPPYQTEERVGALEIRRYPARLVAETTVTDAGWDAALDEGFDRLARYIFGDNRSGASTSPGGEPAKLPMTVPVSVRPDTIAMTAPVQVAARDAGAEVARGRAWTVTFTMPQERSLATLPMPNDARIAVRTSPACRVAVLRYRGRYNGARVARAFADMEEQVRRAGLLPEGAPHFAAYDPPWTVPFLRRNEVWVALAA